MFSYRIFLCFRICLFFSGFLIYMGNFVLTLLGGSEQAQGQQTWPDLARPARQPEAGPAPKNNNNNVSSGGRGGSLPTMSCCV